MPVTRRGAADPMTVMVAGITAAGNADGIAPIGVSTAMATATRIATAGVIAAVTAIAAGITAAWIAFAMTPPVQFIMKAR